MKHLTLDIFGYISASYDDQNRIIDRDKSGDPHVKTWWVGGSHVGCVSRNRWDVGVGFEMWVFGTHVGLVGFWCGFFEPTWVWWDFCGFFVGLVGFLPITRFLGHRAIDIEKWCSWSEQPSWLSHHEELFICYVGWKFREIHLSWSFTCWKIWMWAVGCGFFRPTCGFRRLIVGFWKPTCGFLKPTWVRLL